MDNYKLGCQIRLIRETAKINGLCLDDAEIMRLAIDAMRPSARPQTHAEIQASRQAVARYETARIDYNNNGSAKCRASSLRILRAGKPK